MKKLVLSVLALALFATTALSNVQLATAAYDAEYLAAFDWAKENGLTSMADADAFGPYRNATRGEYSKFIGTFGEDFLCLEKNPEAVCDFSDAAQISPYLTDAVTKACELGLMRGSNGNFFPNTFVSKAQVLATLVRGMEDYMDETTSPWYANYHAYALENGITTVENVNSFDRPVSRYEMLLMLYRARDYECDFETVVETGTVTTGVVVTPGTNRATLVKNANSPMGDNGTIYIAKQSTNNEVLKFDVSSTENGNLTTVTLKLNDTLMDRNAAKVSITDADGVKVTNVRTFNNFAEATLSFTTPVALKANELKSFYVLFDFSGSVNQRGTVAVTAATLSNGAATVEGNVVSANINTIDVSNQSKIEFNSQNTTTSYVSPVSCTTATYVYVGDTNRLLGRFSLNNTSSTKSVSVKAIRLKSAKNLNGIVSNLKLEVGTGTVPATVVIDGKYVTFVMDYALPYSTLRTFYVKGDVVGGDKDDPIEFRLDDASDITARETVSMLAVNTTFTTTAYPYSALYCVKEGSNTISRSDTLSNMNVPMREPLIFGLRANVNTKSAIRVEKVKVYVDNKTTAGALFYNPDRSAENFRLYVNNVMVDSTSTVTCPGTLGTATNPMCYVTFNYYGDLVAGANSLEVRFDSKSNGVAGDRLRFKIDNFSVAFVGNAEYVSTQNDVLTSDFNGVAQGAEMIITNAAVDNISRTDGYANGKVLIRESSDFSAIKFAVRANNVRDLVLNGFRTTATFNPATTNTNYVTDVMAYVDGVLVSTQSFNNGLTATFNSLGIVIPRGSQKEVTLKVTTTSTHPESIVGAAGDVKYTVDAWDLDDTNGNSVANTTVLNGANIDVAGSVSVECKNINPIVTSIVALSSDPVRVASFEFRAKNGNAVINELSLANVLGTQTTVPSTYDVNNLAPLGYDESANGVMLDLYVGSTKVGEAQLVSAIAYAINLNGGAGITLPNNTSVIIDVKARGTTESTSLTKTLRLGVVPSVGYSVLGGTAQTMVAAQNSSATATLGTCGTVANTQLIRNSKLTVTATLPSVTPLLNNVSLNTLFKGSLTTAGSSIQLKKFSFNVNSNTTATLANTKLFIDGNEYSVNQGNATVAGTTVPGTVTVTLTTSQPISASTASIELKSDVNFVDVPNVQDVISTRILKGSPVDYAGYSSDALVPSTATIVWSANDGSSDVWYTDSGILGLETDSYSLKN